jgi:hypothetical protein
MAGAYDTMHAPGGPAAAEGGRMRASRTSLDEDSILAEARARAGLVDFGDESFREPLRRMLRAFESEADLNENGRIAQRERTIGLLANRLRVEEWLRRHPEILDGKVCAPIVIAGLPRTGTTLLHRLISQDPGIFAALWYELRNPAPFAESDLGREDPRIADAVAQVKAILGAVPELASIHPWDPVGADEEIMLLEHTFLSTMPNSAANLPEFGSWVARQDQRPAYRYLERLLKFLQWQKREAGQRGERWVLKAPYHLNTIDVLFEVFPDAAVVQTHRDPLETIPSISSMTYSLWRLAADDPDPVEVGRWWGGWFCRALRRCLELRDERYGDRFVDVWYRDALRDPIAEVRRIYAFVGRELGAAAEARMRRWLRDNARDKRAPHEYSLETFGLTRAGIERDFAAYRERFILGREGSAGATRSGP